MTEIDRMTLRELRLRRVAATKIAIEKNRDMHLQAWLNWCVQGTKKQGNKTVPVYKKFEQFFKGEVDGKGIVPGRLANAYKKMRVGESDGKL